MPIVMQRIPLDRVLVHLALGWKWIAEDRSGWAIWMEAPR